MDKVTFSRGEKTPFSHLYVGQMFYWENRLYIRLDDHRTENARAVDPMEASINLQPAHVVEPCLLSDVQVKPKAHPMTVTDIRKRFELSRTASVDHMTVGSALANCINDWAGNCAAANKAEREGVVIVTEAYRAKAARAWHATRVLGALLCIDEQKLDDVCQLVLDRLEGLR